MNRPLLVLVTGLLSALLAAVIASNASIAVLGSTEGAYFFFAVGGAVGLVGGMIFAVLLGRRRSSPASLSPIPHGSPLRIASQHAREGRTAEAIACLEQELAPTRSDTERPANVPVLAKTAGLLCEQSGALPQAAGYYEEAAAAEEAAGDPDPLTLAALADVRWRMGQGDRAASCLARAEALAKSSSDADTLTVAANMRARWATGH